MQGSDLICNHSMSSLPNNLNSLVAVVVWYNPSENEVINLNKYGKYLDEILIVDNSENDNSHLLSNFRDFIGKIQYIANCNNLGIAKALNIGCQLALKHGFKWILTMDQDSSFSESVFNDYVMRVQDKIKEDASIAVFAPATDKYLAGGFVDKVITSGNILSLDAYSKVNGFDDQLFIDEVDHDLCYKLIAKGFKIYLFNDVFMNHKLGDTRVHNIFNVRQFHAMHHSAIRKYYIIRNRCVMSQRYPKTKWTYLKQNVHLVFSVCFFENDKFKKMLYMINGYLDYKKKVFGKCQHLQMTLFRRK